MAKSVVDDVSFSAAWMKAETVEDILKQFPAFQTVEKLQSKASYMRHKGASLPYLPSRPGAKPFSAAGKKPAAKKPKKLDLRVAAATESGADPEAVYAAAVFDVAGTLEGYRKVQGAAPALRCRVTTSKLCAIERVQKRFGGDVRQLNGSFQLVWNDEEQQHAFLAAIHGHTACDEELLDAAQQFLEANVYQVMAGDNLVKVFKIDSHN